LAFGFWLLAACPPLAGWLDLLDCWIAGLLDCWIVNGFIAPLFFPW
jgi:hypothetical protein